MIWRKTNNTNWLHWFHGKLKELWIFSFSYFALSKKLVESQQKNKKKSAHQCHQRPEMAFVPRLWQGNFLKISSCPQVWMPAIWEASKVREGCPPLIDNNQQGQGRKNPWNNYNLGLRKPLEANTDLQLERPHRRLDWREWPLRGQWCRRVRRGQRGGRRDWCTLKGGLCREGSRWRC